MSGLILQPVEKQQKLLSYIDDPVTRKILIIRWVTMGDITPGQAEKLIRDNGLETA